MGTILQTFGINWYLLVAQVVNFLLILYLLKRFVYKPVFNIIKKREEIIKKGLDDAKKGEESLKTAEEETKLIVKQARDEARSILDSARKEASLTIEEAQEKAKKQSAIIIKEGEEAVKREALKAEEKLLKKIGQIVEEVVKQSLKNILSPEQQKEALKNSLQYLNKLK